MDFSSLPATLVSAFLVTFVTVVIPSPSTVVASRYGVTEGARAAAAFLSAVAVLDTVAFALLVFGFQPLIHNLGAARYLMPVAGVGLIVGGVVTALVTARRSDLVASRDRWQRH